MKRTLAMLMVAAGLVLGALGLASPAPQPIVAGEVDPLLDSDGDFLPDAVEWVVMTNPALRDTDDDGCSDFIEVVQRGAPRQPGVARATDHEMRVVITAPGPGAAGSATWCHLLFRFVGDSSMLTSFQASLELGNYQGLQVPLDVLSFGSVVWAERVTAADGIWAVVSVPMVSAQVLRSILPCNVHANAVIGGRAIHTAASLMDLGGEISSVVPFAEGRLAVQSIGRPLVTGQSTNKVCVLEVEQVGSGLGGTAYQVVAADCEDCNELECGTSCAQSVGWIFSVAGGLNVITGN